MARYLVSVERYFGGNDELVVEADNKIEARRAALAVINLRGNYKTDTLKVVKKMKERRNNHA